MRAWVGRFLLFRLFIVALLGGCSASSHPPDGPKQNAQWGQYIAGHTAGLVSRNSKIRVLFVNGVVGKDAVGTSADRLIELEPATKFSSTFASEREIVITPAQPLTPGTGYRVRMHLKKMIALPEKLDTYEFQFNVIKPDFDVKLAGLTANAGSTREMSLSGTVITADIEDSDRIEKMVSAQLAHKDQKVEWQHASDGRRHDFKVEHVARRDQDATLKVAWTGAPIGVDRKGEDTLEVPAVAVFKVTQVTAVTEAPQHIAIAFSDALDPRQNLNGMLQTDQGQGKVRIEGSSLHIYPEKRFTGQVSVTIERGIKNARGERLPQQVQQTVKFASERPQVRFIGKGVILPDNAVLSVPFEAVNVNSVQVTAFRVYDNNVGRFLQTNKLDGDQDLDRVGRFLWRKTIALPPLHADAWTRYELDATQLLKDNPGGLFRITLSINRGNSAYGCTSEDNRVPTHKEDPLANSEDIDRKEHSSWDYAEELNDTDRDRSTWADRENPCKDAYYKFGRGVRESRNFLASDIGLLAKRDQRGKVHVVATSLKTAQPLSGVSLKLFNFQDQPAATASTDTDGFAELEPASTPFYLAAEHNGQKGYLKLNAGTALTVSHFDVGGEKVEAGVKGMIYGERGVWRPGDDIHLTFVLQDKEGAIPANHPVTMHLYNPHNQLMQSVTNVRPVGGFYTFKLTTAQDAPTGNWTARAQLGGSTFAKTVKVETVAPNRLKLELELGKDALYPADMPLKGQINAQWLHGAMASGLKADVAVRLESMPTHFGRNADFVFDDPARQFKAEQQTVFEGNLNDQGQATFQHDLIAQAQAPGALSAQFTTRVFEEGGAFSSSQRNVPFFPYPHYIGIKMPKGDQARSMLLTDQTHSIAIASLDAHGKPVSLPKVQVTIYKIEWKWWWDKTGDALAQYAKGEHSTPLKEGEIATKNGQGSFEFEVKYPEWGRYLVRACDTEGGHCSGTVFYMDWPGWAGHAREEGGSGAGVLSFSSDKPEYKVGETALIQLPPATQGRALMTIENGSGVLHKRWIELSKDNTRFEVPVTATMTPNVYVNVTLIQPHQGKDNDRPIRLYGVIPLRVEDPATVLTPRVKAPDEWKPESMVSVAVSEAKGRSMTYTLAIVDEGLLGLTGYKTPDLHEHFYKKEALGVSTWDLFDYVAGAYGGELERVLALGGDDSAGSNEGKTSKKRFPPVVKFMGPFELKAKGNNKHEVKLPPYIGAVRVMVVAAERGAYGSAAKTVAVRQPLSMLATLPRVLGPGEELSVPVSLFVMDPSIKDVSLSAELDGHFEMVGGDSVHVMFDKPGERLGFLTMKVRPMLGKGTLRLVAVSGKHRTRSEINIDIRSANPRTVEVMQKALAPGETWEQDVTPHGFAGTNEVTLEVSSIRPLNLERRLDYLIQYPHGCVEQTTSSVFPQLYLSRLTKLDEQRKRDIDANIRAGIDRLRLFQVASGGFTYWPGSAANFYNDWASNYAGHFLVQADQLGYAVPPLMLNDWIAHQKNLAQAWKAGGSDSMMEQAYRLYTLAEVNQPVLGAMNRLREMNGLTAVVRWQLAAAYKLAGHADAAEQLVRTLQPEASDYADPGPTFGSKLRDRAIILNSLIVLGDLDHAGVLSRAISDELASGQWYSTQSVAYALMAMGRLAGADPQGNVFAFEQSVGNGGRKSVRSDKPILTEKLAGFLDAGDTVRIHNTSEKAIFVQVTVKGAPPAGDEKAAAAGLRLDVKYADKAGHTIEPEHLEQGADYVATVTVTNLSEGKLDNLALSHIVPSGWELHNARLGSLQAKAPEGIDYQDIRDDRIYSYFSIAAHATKTVELAFNAAYQGSYYLPAVSVEAMYDATRHAQSRGQWVKVVKSAH